MQNRSSLVGEVDERSAYTIDEWCGRVHPMARAVCYAQIKAGVLKSYQLGRRRYIPASERTDFPARLLAAQQ
jgi:hypothetical protein